MKAYREIIEAKWYCQNCVGDRNTDEYSDSIGLGSASIHIRCYECKESIFLHLQGEPPTWKGLEDRVERLEHRLADISDAAPFSFVEEKVGKVSAEVSGVEQDVSGIEQQIEGLRSRIQDLEQSRF